MGVIGKNDAFGGSRGATRPPSRVFATEEARGIAATSSGSGGSGTRADALCEAGQMTVEIAVTLPILITIAIIAVNVLVFFSHCAVFDRVAHEAIRAHATSPAYGQGIDQSCALVEQAISSALDADGADVSVSHGMTGPDFDRFTATLEWSPTLFGRGPVTEVFGVSLPRLSHSTTYVVDVYKPGVIV